MFIFERKCDKGTLGFRFFDFEKKNTYFKSSVQSQQTRYNFFGQQGVDLSKKMSKKKIDSTFTDVHTDCQKLGTILENKVVQKLKFSKNDKNKIPSFKLVIN